MTGASSLPPGVAAGFKVVRMIGTVHLDAVAGVRSSGTYGMSVVSRDLVASGGFHPAVDLLDYYYLKHYNVFDAAGRVSDFPFDIRTSRLVRGLDRTLAFVIDVLIGNVTFSLDFRLLLEKK